MIRVTPRKSFHDRVAEKAYEIWEACGRPDGQAKEHWREAEQMLRDRDGERFNLPGALTLGGSMLGQRTRPVRLRARR